MEVITQWLELTVKQYGDDSFEAYDILSDSQEEGDWEHIRWWIERILLSEIEELVHKSPDKSKRGV